MTWPPNAGDTVPRAEDAYGVRAKLLSYSLNPEHRDGGDKARVFESILGLKATDADHLARALVDGLATTPIRRVRDNPPHGVLCDVWITVSGLGAGIDRTAEVRTAWELRHENDAPRLVTAFISA